MPAGTLVVLLGPSGCGKTTLLKMVNRLIEPTSGTIHVGGIEIHDLPATELRRHIGYVIQQVGLFPHMTVSRNISTVPRLLKWPGEEVNQRTRQLLAMVGLPEEYLSRYPRQLSGGEQQRVGLARALAADPGILLMDEPFAAIDAITRTRLQEELLDIHQKVGKTILFVTHDVEEALRLADRMVIMRQGEIVQYASPLEVMTRPADAFVANLVGSGDLLRRLSVIEVGMVLQELRATQAVHKIPDGAKVETVDARADLRSVLSQVMDSGADWIRVVDQQGNEVATLSFQMLRSLLARQSQPDSA